ncbi:hypothetical protein B0A48_05784 [Cryoendolithus antarcticus]|uniref:Uncharacterized protein n=1 Tax=Cryoendolithus antarcticus TaxID=1507870 RepID=A0A1V8TC87_9PEZI|nr:hypothetical protein B0A48_05784 [Cryoendolithus antarcticus]
MADDNNPPPQRTRRSSFAGQTFADLFGGSRPARPSNNDSQPAQQFPGPITSAAAQAQQRRLSIATLGLSGSPNSTTSPFGSLRGLNRRDSLSSANSGSLDESAIEDEPSMTTAGSGSVPHTPFARRMSFGARAMRDIRTSSGSAGGGGTSPGLQNGRSPPPVVSSKPGNSHARVPSVSASNSSSTANNGTISARANGGRGLSSLPLASSRCLSAFTYSVLPEMSTDPFSQTGEGFNWSDNLRSRAERTSIAAPSGISAGNGSVSAAHHARAKSVATMEPPIREIPKPVASKPDHFQERILKGDFYMD